MVIKRMRCKVIYCYMKESIETETYGLKCQETPHPINKLPTFENNLIELIKIYQIPNSTQPATKNVKIRYKINPTI